MKKSRFFAVVMAFVLVLAGTALARQVKAAEAAVELKAERSGDDLSVSLIANEAITITSGQFTISFDSSVFTKKTVTSDFTVTGDDDVVVLFGADAVDYTTGQAIVVITFSIGDGFEKNKEYTFNLVSDQFTDANYEEYGWSHDTFSVNYIEKETETSSSGTTASDTTAAATTAADTTAADTTAAATTQAEQTTAAETTAAETTAVDSTTAAATTEEGSTPPTGDNSATPVFIVTGCAAAVLLGVLLVMRKKSNKAE